MKLIHPSLGKQIIFSENKINVLTIENRTFYTNFIKELSEQIESTIGNFVLSRDNKELNLSKEFDLLIDLFHLDLNNKKHLSKIYGHLKEIAYDEENYKKTMEFNKDLINYIDDIIFKYDLPLEYEPDLDLTGLLKIIGLNIELTNSELLNQLIQYIKVSFNLGGISCFVFVNLKDFLTFEEIAEFYKFASYSKIHILLLESSCKDLKHDCEEHYVIDEDLCEIY